MSALPPRKQTFIEATIGGDEIIRGSVVVTFH
jgi:hypothetical protein